jgi:hypothetical protein
MNWPQFDALYFYFCISSEDAALEIHRISQAFDRGLVVLSTPAVDQESYADSGIVFAEPGVDGKFAKPAYLNDLVAQCTDLISNEARWTRQLSIFRQWHTSFSSRRVLPELFG